MYFNKTEGSKIAQKGENKFVQHLITVQLLHYLKIYISVCSEAWSAKGN